MKAKDVADFAFARLMLLEEEGRIKAGTQEERDFLKREIELGFHNLFQTHGVTFFPKITVDWDPLDPEELTIRYCPQTNKLLSQLGLV